jgi:hypothetical protein
MDATRPGILLDVGGLDEWVLPEPQPTSAAERDRLRDALERWAQRYRGTVTFVADGELVRPWEDE